MSASQQRARTPMFTRQMLEQIEQEMATNNQYFFVQNISGQDVMVENDLANTAITDPTPGNKAARHLVRFARAHDLRPFHRGRINRNFVSTFASTVMLEYPNRTEQEARNRLHRIIKEFEASAEAASLAAMLRLHLKGRPINKVIGFGLGYVSHDNGYRSVPDEVYEHAAALWIAKTLRGMNPLAKIDLLCQDPAYTSVCKTILPEVGFDIVEGYGARGFLMVDEHTVVLSHHPNFPLRHVIGDLTRPALLCMARVKSELEAFFTKEYHEMIDGDTARSRAIIKEYYEVRHRVPNPKAFYNSTWYFRKQ